MALPASVIAVDVETTGFHSNDRIISLGAWRVSTADLSGDALDTECIHIISDPGKKSHPRAEEVHGYSDWTLRHQQPFAEHASTVRDFLSRGDIVIAHNASFDLEFIDREYRALGQPSPSFNHYCTMNGYRQSGLLGRASLKAICQEMGLARVGKSHGALEDAWLALMIYFWLHRVPAKHIQPFGKLLSLGAVVGPHNFREPPPLPPGPLPRRRNADQAIAAARREVTANIEALMKAVRPTAILLLEIARADERLAAEEVDILAALIRATRDRLALPLDEEAEREVIAELFDLKLTQNLVTRAAGALYRDDAARDAFPKWFATMATADGDISASKQAGIDRVKAAITRVLPG